MNADTEFFLKKAIRDYQGGIQGFNYSLCRLLVYKLSKLLDDEKMFITNTYTMTPIGEIVWNELKKQISQNKEQDSPQKVRESILIFNEFLSIFEEEKNQTTIEV